MPLYEYKCHSCGKTIEVLQRFSDEPLKTHEGCGGDVERLISASAFHLKGSGWYATDYAKSNGEKPGEKQADEKKADEKKSDDKKAESKPGESGAAQSSSSGESKSEAKPAATESKESKPAAPAGDSKP
jgi:putative FmdB family regulatory protein